MAEQAFSAQVSAWVAETQERMAAVFRESSERVIEVMQTPVGGGGNMPVVTGFLRASLQVTKDAPVPTSRDNPDPSGSFTYNGGTASLVILGADIGETIYAAYGALYARSVNYGKAGKPGRQFVGLAAQRWPQIVEAACQDLQSRVSGGSSGSTPST